MVKIQSLNTGNHLRDENPQISACKLRVGYIFTISSLVCNVLSHHYVRQDGQEPCILFAAIPAHAPWLHKISCFKFHILSPMIRGEQYQASDDEAFLESESVF